MFGKKDQTVEYYFKKKIYPDDNDDDDPCVKCEITLQISKLQFPDMPSIFEPLSDIFEFV